MLAGSSCSIYFFLILSIALIMWPFSVQGQTFCLERTAFAADLFKEFKEIPIAMGISMDKTRIIEIFVSPKGETFTIVFTTATGMTCPLVAGERWLDISKSQKHTSRIEQ